MAERVHPEPLLPKSERRRRRREQVDFRESQSTNYLAKDLDWERPIRQRLETICCIREEILLQ